MRIEICDRASIVNLASTPFEPDTALISIADYGDSFAELRYQPDALLRLVFNDLPISDDAAKAVQLHTMTDAQAEQIAAFYKRVCGKAKILICQCEYGESRSAAIAAAILEYASQNGKAVFASDVYCPNMSVYHKVLAALREMPG